VSAASPALSLAGWNVAVLRRRPNSLLQLSLASRIARDAYEKYRTLLDSSRVAAHPERRTPGPPATSVASTGTKDPHASNILYVEALALPFHNQHNARGYAKALAAHAEFGEARPEDTNKILAELPELVLTRAVWLLSC